MQKPELNTAQDMCNFVSWNGIVFHMDPGHGWLEVPKDVVQALGIEGKITQYSYQKDNKYFLEEDCDLFTFMQALGVQPQSEMNTHFWANCPTRNHDYDAPLRNYQRVKKG